MKISSPHPADLAVCFAIAIAILFLCTVAGIAVSFLVSR
jgi:hypothetical protein